MKKLLCVLLASLLMIPTLSACFGGDNGENSGTSSTSDSGTGDSGEPVTPAEVLEIIKDKKTSYVICRPDKADREGELVSACRDLSNAFFKATGVTVNLANDWFKDAADIPEYEILVGGNDRDETRSVAEGMLGANYAIRVVGKKLVIVGGSDEATVNAVKYFIRTFLEDKTFEDGSFSFAKESEYTYNYSYALRSVKVCGVELKDFCIVLPENAKVSEYRAAVRMKMQIESLYGVALPIVNDKKTYDHEILVGKTSGSGAMPDGHKFTFGVKGGKLYLAAGSLYGYEAAIDHIGKEFLDSTVADQSLDEGYSYTADAAKDFKDGTQYADRKLGEIRIMINNMYGNCNATLYPREQRQRQLCELYFAYDPDIIGLQECNAANRTGNYSITKLMADAGYAEVDASGKANNSTPLFYKTSRLNLLGKEYKQYPNGKGDASKGYTYGVFEVKATGKKFAVLSTHYWWKHVDASDDQARLVDAETMLAAKDAIIKKYGEIPVFCAGDFNCNTSSSSYGKVVSGGMTDVFTVAEKKENVKTHHSYPEYDKVNKLYINPVMPSGGHDKSIDQFFVSKNSGVRIKLYEVVTDLYSLLSTDHCPMVVDFDF